MDGDTKILLGALLVVVAVFGIFTRIAIVFALVGIVGIVLVGLGLLGRGREE